MEYPHLSNAPIREAIIDIRVKHKPEFKISEFRSLKEKVSNDYPVMKDRNAFTSELRFSSPDKTDLIKKEKELDAIIFSSEDKKEILQLKKSGFTFNKLDPYSNWEDIIQKAKKAWEFYKEVSEPLFVTRIATRYINNIVLPLNSNLDDFLQNAPKIPQEGPSLFINSLSRNTLIEPSQDILVHLTQAIETKENNIAIIIDIDAFKDKQFDLEKDVFWEDFKELREMKNNLFFNSLTEKTIDKYK